MSDAAPAPVPASRLRIGDLAREAGPAVSTLRTWQERYPGLLRPTRTPGGHRVYGEADLAAVREMRRLVAAGRTVSAAAAEVTAARDARDARDARADGPAPPAEPAPRTWWATSVDEELDAVRAAHAATRAFLRATSPADVAAALGRFVEEVGGGTRPAGQTTADTIPLDVSLGVGQPVLVVATPGSGARRRLEALLPMLVDDARFAASRLRTGRRARRSRPAGPPRPSSGEER
jgi:DNA-binding transcriptional MerR regulator